MDGLRDVQQFVDECRRAPDMGSLRGLVDGTTRTMGFDYFAVVQHVDMRENTPDSVVWLENYPASWADVFIESGLHAYDPIMQASERTNVGFLWSDVDRLIPIETRHRKVLEAARREGMGDGLTIPAHVPGEGSGSSSFAVRDGRSLDAGCLIMAQLVGSHAYEAARLLIERGRMNEGASERPRLTTRQLDCLQLVARGKSDWEIAQILGIRESTVHDHIEDARARYGVTRRIQLVLRAIHDGHLTLADAIG